MNVRRLHHLLIFILSVTFPCLSTGMSHIHICSNQCCKEMSHLMHSSIPDGASSCYKSSPSVKTTSQQLSTSCHCLQIDYSVNLYPSTTNYVLPAVMPINLPTSVFTWHFFSVQSIHPNTILSHAPPLTGRNRLIQYSILII